MVGTCNRSILRARPTTLSPFLTNSWAMAAPIPELAPVTAATRPAHRSIAEELTGRQRNSAPPYLPRIMLSITSNLFYFLWNGLLSDLYKICLEPGWRSRYSVWLRAGRQRGRSSSPSRVKNFLISTSSRPVLRPTEPPTQWVPGALSPGVKRPGREADRLPPTSAEVKKTWIYTSTPPYAFMA
jgi:hypothetical protein